MEKVLFKLWQSMKHDSKGGEIKEAAAVQYLQGEVQPVAAEGLQYVTVLPVMYG